MSVLLINYKICIDPQCVWWVDLSWLPGAPPSCFLTLTPFNGAQGGNMMEDLMS